MNKYNTYVLKKAQKNTEDHQPTKIEEDVDYNQLRNQIFISREKSKENLTTYCLDEYIEKTIIYGYLIVSFICIGFILYKIFLKFLRNSYLHVVSRWVH
jgi:hypothetical protein